VPGRIAWSADTTSVLAIFEVDVELGHVGVAGPFGGVLFVLTLGLDRLRDGRTNSTD
jgi:hypothetical protein